MKLKSTHRNFLWILQPRLEYSRVEMAADARHGPWSCTHVLRMGRNAADAVRSARPKGWKLRWLKSISHGKS